MPWLGAAVRGLAIGASIVTPDGLSEQRLPIDLTAICLPSFHFCRGFGRSRFLYLVSSLSYQLFIRIIR